MRGKGLGTGFLAALLLVLLWQPAQSSEKQHRDQDPQERDSQSRNEVGPRSVIPLKTRDGNFWIRRVVIIQSKIVHVATTEDFGVDYTNLDKVDLGSVPLVGQLFSRELSADDLTDATRVGASYMAGDDILAAVVDDDVDVGELRVSVVNGKGSYQIKIAPQIAEVAPSGLAEFGALPSVHDLLTQVSVPDGTTVVLGGLTRDKVPEVEDKIPVLADVPVLQSLFRGTVHQKEKKELLILIKPTILIQEEE